MDDRWIDSAIGSWVDLTSLIRRVSHRMGHRSVEELAAEQGIQPVVDLDELDNVTRSLDVFGTRLGDADRDAVWLCPGRRGGDACVIGTRLTTRQIAADVRAGLYEDIYADSELSRSQILVACWYEAEHGPAWRYWGHWANEHSLEMHRSDWENVPLPPIAAPPEP